MRDTSNRAAPVDRKFPVVVIWHAIPLVCMVPYVEEETGSVRV
jgi:hypothetical protein